MNIAIFTDTFLPRFDGVITSILNTAEEFIRRGNTVRVFAPRIRKNQDEMIREYLPGLDFSLIPGVSALFYPDFRVTVPVTPWVIRELKKMQADVIHFHTPFTMGMEGILSSAYLSLPLISTFHTYFIEPEYLKIVHLHRLPGITRFGWAYSNFFHNMCDVTISPSQYTADELIRKNLRCPVRVISNGIPLRASRDLSEEEKEEIRRKFGLKKNVMLFIGRVSVEKCIDVVMRAAAKIFQGRNDTTLLIVGDGPAFEQMKELAKEMGIQENTVFTGGIPHAQLIESGIFEISKFFVTASTSENQPMTIIESSMFGLPIIGVNAKGIPEMISDNGFIAEPGNEAEIADYMQRLIEDDELHKKMSKGSIRKGQEYDIVKTTDQMEKLYEVLIKKVKRQGKRRRISLKTLYKILGKR
ncbi:MAG: glycosyltransferase [Candidatus Eremiobacteraeota bacterium]|nr:glycosyltransferase [Candidatus Eremiobacteraeota bacterium]